MHLFNQCTDFINSDEVFSAYRHREILPGCRPHPGDIVEAGSLAVCIQSI